MYRGLDNIEKDKNKQSPRYSPNFATVSNVSPLKIIIDGDTDALDVDVKKYKHVSIAVGDRVKFTIVSGMYLIEGVI